MGKFCKCPFGMKAYNIELENVSMGIRKILKQYEKKNIRNNYITRKKLVCICHDS